MTPELKAAYREPHRRYHTLAHIEACLAELAKVSDLSPENRRLLELAIWWHDAVYDPTRGDNEERSAELAQRHLEGTGESPRVLAEVARLIRLTKGHAVEPGDRLGALMVSIDLAILGSSQGAYDRYAEDIRQEYAFAPDEQYRVGRAAVMRRFLEDDIYPHPDFAARFGRTARANIERELTALSA